MNEKRFLRKSRFARIRKNNWNERRGERRKVKRKKGQGNKKKLGRRGENERKTQGTLQTTYPRQEVTKKQERFQ